MAFHNKSLCFLMAFFFIFMTSSSHAKTFEVGGKDGWTLHPSENYNHWSGRMRFLINDTLHFKYGGSDSVLVVNKGDYDGCNTDKPIMKLDGGDSSFKFDRSGPFYFISGNKSNCNQGQKLIVVVLALRNRSPPPSPVTPPPTATTPPSPSPATPPTSTTTPPVSSPISPPSPSTITPVLPPSTAISPSSPPSGSPEVIPPPAYSPGGGGEIAPSPGGGSSTSPGGGGALSPGGGRNASSPGGGNSADVNTPPSGRPSSSPPPLAGTVITSLVTMIFAVWWMNLSF